MTWRKKKEDEDDLDFEYEGEPPRHNLLDYRYMFIEMTRWAHTDVGCLSSVLVGVALFFICMILLTIYVSLVGR